MKMAKEHIDKITLICKGTAQLLSTTMATLISFPRKVYTSPVHADPGTALLSSNCYQQPCEPHSLACSQQQGL